MPETLGTITIEAGPHTRLWTPCAVAAPDLPPGTVTLAAGSERVAGEVREGVLSFVLPRLARGAMRTYRVQPGGADSPGVRLTKRAGKVDVEVLGERLTSYHWERCPARPYLAPLLGPGGVELTRAVEDKARPGYDHVHHRSVWIAHGLVNGTDNWSEEPGHGRSLHREFGEITGGPVGGVIAESLTWVTASGAPILEEERRIRFHAQPAEARCIDFEIALSTGHDAVLFGDTKEGGLLSVRVNPSMNAPAGTIENSAGGVNEDETWGKRAHWCDYSGDLGGGTVGIAILDHPANFAFPVWWHVRNYGLMTANPFGLSYFEEGSGRRGDWVLAARSTAVFRYRLYTHAGDARKGRVADAWHDWVHPPKATMG